MREFLIRLTPFMLMAGTIFYLSSLSSPQLPDLGFDAFDKVLHAGAYFLLTLTARPLAGGIARRQNNVVKTWIAFGAAVAFGITDELHQLSVEGRSADAIDWVADCAGSLAAVVLILRFSPILQRWYRRTIIRTGDS